MAIYFAAMMGYISVLELMISKGLDVKLKGEQSMNILHFACKEGHFELVQYIVENKLVRLYTKDKLKRQPMILAIMNGHLKIVSYLLQNGAMYDDPDSSSNSPLHYACAYGYYKMIDLLILAGANINMQNSWKYTPLGIAVAKKHFKIVNLLVQHNNIDLNVKNDKG